MFRYYYHEKDYTYWLNMFVNFYVSKNIYKLENFQVYFFLILNQFIKLY